MCSVLFCDVVGFTPLSEARDPEAVRELLSQYFAVARTVITRYGGVVEKFIGDAVMAVWGTPAATEEDAERAVRAALDLVAAVAELGAEAGLPGLAARAGVVTGEVAVTLGAVGEGMVAGDAVNTASRVQAAAEPGAVLADAATQRLAGSAIGFADAGEHALKGKASRPAVAGDPGVVGGGRVAAGGRAGGAADRPGRGAAHGQGPVPRRRGPAGAAAGAGVGPAGVGKSRLGWEFEKYADGLARRCGGTGAGACPTGRGWRSGRWPRSSGSGWASPRRNREVAAGKLAKGLARGSWPTRPSAGTSALRLGRLLGVAARQGTTGPRCRGRNCSPGGGCSSPGWLPCPRWRCW